MRTATPTSRGSDRGRLAAIGGGRRLPARIDRPAFARRQPSRTPGGTARWGGWFAAGRRRRVRRRRPCRTRHLRAADRGSRRRPPPEPVSRTAAVLRGRRVGLLRPFDGRWAGYRASPRIGSERAVRRGCRSERMRQVVARAGGRRSGFARWCAGRAGPRHRALPGTASVRRARGRARPRVGSSRAALGRRRPWELPGAPRGREEGDPRRRGCGHRDRPVRGALHAHRDGGRAGGLPGMHPSGVRRSREPSAR